MAEIMEATGWQKHTVRGFVSILGKKRGEKIESSKNAAVERMCRVAKQANDCPFLHSAAFGLAAGGGVPAPGRTI